jgi:hypothetical protein
MDLSGMDAQALHDAAMSAFEHLDIIKREIFDWASQVVDQRPISENPDLVNRCIDIAWKAVPITVYFRAVTIAAAREIEVRSKRNKTNYYFGLFKLARHFGIVELQQKAWRQLQRILSAIPYKSSWFHPEGKDGWLDVVNLVVTQLLNEYASLDASSTLKGMAENRFASVYQRVKARFIDEIRRLIRKPKEIAVGDVGVSSSAADEGLQRLAVINLVGEVASRYGEKDARTEILKKVEALLENPEQIPDDPREIRAEFVRDIAQNRGVSKQQARRDLREFKEMIKADETLQSLRDDIRALGQMRIVLREVQRAPEVSEED